MQATNKILRDLDEPDEAARRYCALLASAMVLKLVQGTYFAAFLLAENEMELEHAVMALALAPH